MAIQLGIDYLYEAFTDSDTLIRHAKEALEGVNFDTMIGTGLSGSLVIPILAREMNKHWAIVRKDNDNTHSMSEIEGVIGARWIFVDDFTASGSTRKRVIQAVTNTMNGLRQHATYVGDYLYHPRIFYPASPTRKDFFT